MKNLFKSISVGVLLLAATSASAGTLFWQVTTESNKTFEEAWLVVADSSDNGALTYLDNRDSDRGNPSSTPLTQTDVTGYEGSQYTFFIEMCNYDSSSDTYTTVATGREWSYNDLVSNGYVSTGAVTAHSAMTAAANANMGQIPEPSSGLLLLMGGAMLALRRRRQK